MQVRFWFDPLCPWCWITSHWLDGQVAPHRDLDIDWRTISLHVRNEGRQLSEGYDELRPMMTHSFRLLRIVEALRAEGRVDVVRPLYLAFGRHIHHGRDEEEARHFDVAAALEEAGVARTYAEAYDDDRWDEAVRASTREAEDVAGDDVGTPIIAYQVDGAWKGYFGPVLPELVTGEAALRLWDGLAALIATDGFYELKRTRTVGPRVETIVG